MNIDELARLKQENEALLGQRSILSDKLDARKEEIKNVNRDMESLRLRSGEESCIAEEEIKSLRKELSEVHESRSREESSSPHHEIVALKEEVERYRCECVSLAAKLSRAEALARRSNK